MKYYLIVARGKRKGLPVPIDFDLFLIGSDASCQLRAAHESIGEQHCAIVTREKKVFIVDLDSGGSTFVNGAEIPPGEETPLHAGDMIDVGPLEFIVNFHERQMVRSDLEEWAQKCLDKHGINRIDAKLKFEDVAGPGEAADAAQAAASILDQLVAYSGVESGRMRISCERGVTIVRLHEPYLVEEPEVRAVERDLNAHVARPRLRALLDLKEVRRLSSRGAEMIGAFRSRMLPTGGRLALCRLRPDIRQLLHTLPATQEIPVFEHKPDALAARW